MNYQDDLQKIKRERLKQMRKEMREESILNGHSSTPLYIVVFLVIALIVVVLAGNSRNVEYQVMTSEYIVVQEKRISGSGYSLVLSNGEETYNLPVSESIYDSYQPGDPYRHDADQKSYDGSTD